VHLAGKGVLRFHAVYWPAMLLSAGQPLPTDILVHDYLTTDGHKISKSGGGAPDPAELARRFGTDTVRWWLLREVPRVGDADFTAARLIARANADLAGGLGNLVSRNVALVHRYRAGALPGGIDRAGALPGGVDRAGALPGGVDRAGALPGGIDRAGARPDRAGPVAAEPGAARLTDACQRAPGLIAAALDGFDFRGAASAAWDIVDQANRYIEHAAPWYLARAQRDDPAAARLDAVLDVLIRACRCLATQLAPFIPDTAARVAAQCTPPGPGRPLPDPEAVFPRIDAA
jgi:methionyl-tRNA synthetase